MRKSTFNDIDQELVSYRDGGEETPTEMLATAAKLIVQSAIFRNDDERIIAAIVRLVAYVETPYKDRDP